MYRFGGGKGEKVVDKENKQIHNVINYGVQKTKQNIDVIKFFQNFKTGF